MEVRSRILEITVISGENLCVDQNLEPENAYVVVRTESLSCCTTKMATDSGSHPMWNEKLLLNMPMHAKSITFDVQCKTSKGIIKNIGVARIAVSDFLGGGDVSESCLQVLSYRLRDWEGRRNGVINFSARVKTPENSSMLANDRNSGEFQSGVKRCHMNEKNSNGVVSGIPAWWNHPINV